MSTPYFIVLHPLILPYLKTITSRLPPARGLPPRLLLSRAGKGQALEELATRDLSEVVPQLVREIEAWRRRTAAQLLLQRAARGWQCRRAYRGNPM